MTASSVNVCVSLGSRLFGVDVGPTNVPLKLPQGKLVLSDPWVANVLMGPESGGEENVTDLEVGTLSASSSDYWPEAPMVDEDGQELPPRMVRSRASKRQRAIRRAT